MVDDEVNRDRPQFVFHVADGENREFLVYVHVGGLVDEPLPGALGVFGKALGQGLPALHVGEHQFQVGKDGRRNFRKIRFRRDVPGGVCLG